MKEKLILQKLMGIILIILGIIIPIVNNGDATVSIMCIPVGIVLLITKEVYIYD